MSRQKKKKKKAGCGSKVAQEFGQIGQTDRSDSTTEEWEAGNVESGPISDLSGMEERQMWGWCTTSPIVGTLECPGAVGTDHWWSVIGLN